MMDRVCGFGAQGDGEEVVFPGVCVVRRLRRA